MGGGAGAGAFFGGMFDGIGKGMMERAARQDRLRMVATEAGLKQLSSMANDPTFAGDPEAHRDISHAIFSILGDMQNNGGRGNKRKGQPGSVEHAQQLVGDIMNKVYPSGMGEAARPATNATIPGELPGLEHILTAPPIPKSPDRIGPFYSRSDMMKQHQAAEQAKADIEQNRFIKQQGTLLDMKQAAEVAEKRQRDENFGMLIKQYPEPVAYEMAYSRRYPGPIVAQHPSIPTMIELKDGSTVLGWQDRYNQKFMGRDGSEIKPDTIKQINTKPDNDSVGEQDRKLAYQAYAEKHKLDSEKLSAQQRVDAQRDFNQRTRISAATNQGGGGAGSPLTAGGKYVPGGPSVVNPAGDRTVDMHAWEYINTGKMTFTGMSSGGKGSANKRELGLARAYEILEDLGITPSELPALRGNIKANSLALNKITTLGSQISQFENTLTKNLETAKTLSAKFDRTPLPFVNRLMAAWNTGTGGSEANNLAAQLHGVAREWAKIMAGSTSAAGVPISEAKDAEKIMSGYLSKNSLESLFEDVIKPDIENRTQAIAQEKDAIVQRLRSSDNRGSIDPGANSGANKLPKPGKPGELASVEVMRQYMEVHKDKSKALEALKSAGYK